METLRFLAVNDAAILLYGHSRAEFLGLTLRDIRPPEDIPALEWHVAHVRQTLLHDSGVWQHYTKSGAILHVKVFGYTVEFRGKLARCVQVHNVTAEQQLLQRQEAIERSLAVMRHAPMDYWTITSRDGVILHQSESAEHILGYKLSERIGKNALECVHPDDVHLLNAIASSFASPFTDSTLPLRLTYRYRHAESRWLWIESIVVDMTSDSLVQGVLVSSRNVSERKERELAIEHSERFLRSLFMAMPDIVLVIDRNGHYLDIVTSNPDLLHKSIEDVMGRSIHDLFSPEQTKEWLAIIRQALELEQIMQTEYTLDFPNPCTTKYIWFEAKIVPLAFDRVLWVARDITDRKTAQERLQEVNEQLQRLNEEKNSLLEIVAHDLKNPLMGIRELAAMIADQNLTIEEMREVARAIHRAADRSLVFVQDALSSQAIASGAMQMKLESVVAEMVVGHVLDSYTAIAASKRITVQFQAPEHSVCILGDEGALFQIVDNLVSNALKYSPLGKHITVRLVRDAHQVAKAFAHAPEQTLRSANEAAKRWVMVAVEDEGPGLSESDRSKLFTKFTRLSPQPTGGEHSTGLGLSIVKQLVERMNGHIWCNSVEGQGATFVVMLPLA